MMTEQTLIPKIPVLAMVKGSIASLYRNPSAALAILGIWVIPLTWLYMEYIPTKYIFQLYFLLSLESAPAQSVALTATVSEAQTLLAEAMSAMQNKILGFMFMGLMLRFMLSLGWMRFILTGENKSLAGLMPNGQILRVFGAALLWLLVFFAGFAVITIALPYIINIFGFSLEVNVFILFGVTFFYIIYMFFNALRLLPWLASRMQEGEKLSPLEVWQRTKGQNFRILAGCFFSIVPGAIISIVLITLSASFFEDPISPTREEVFAEAYQAEEVEAIENIDELGDMALPEVPLMADIEEEMPADNEEVAIEPLTEAERMALELQISMIDDVEFNKFYLFLLSLITALIAVANSFIISGFLSFVYQFTCRREV